MTLKIPHRFNKAGLFITFEGIDGCGKSTQLRLAGDWLQSQGLATFLTKEPGATPIGAKIRAILLDPENHALDSRAELLLYLADRLQHLHEEILPLKQQGQVILCDRYHDSTEAYQRFGRGLDFSTMESLFEQWIRPHFPDLTLWFDVPLNLAMQRIQVRSKGANLKEAKMDQESQAFFARVAEGFKILAQQNPQRIIRIDGTGTVAEVGQRVQDSLSQWLN